MQSLLVSNQTQNINYKGYIKNTLALNRFKKGIDIVKLANFYKKHNTMKSIKDGKEYTFKVEKAVINLNKSTEKASPRLALVLKSYLVDEADEMLDFAYITKPKDILKTYTKDKEPIKQEDYSFAIKMFERLFKKAAEVGVGIELNACDMCFTDEEADIVLRPYRIAKQCGCKFYCGSDAHHPDELDNAKAIFERAIDLLELTEEDKFVIGVSIIQLIQLTFTSVVVVTSFSHWLVIVTMPTEGIQRTI
jgi:histidinol phosphatase-like PHP family hydrolase